MKKSTKGALAASAAGVLLLGGAGSLAYWTDTQTADAGSLESGSLTLNTVTCAGWKEGITTISKIVPGDTVTNVCTGSLVLVGDHIGATVDLDDASVAAVQTAFNNEVTITAELTAPAAPITAAGTHTVTVTVSAAFSTAATNVSQDVTQALSGLELTATQSHDLTP